MVLSYYLNVIQMETGRLFVLGEKASVWEANVLLATQGWLGALVM